MNICTCESVLEHMDFGIRVIYIYNILHTMIVHDLFAHFSLQLLYILIK